jgi:hypothetical protein
MVIISHKHKFIYIKTRKTASTSIQVLLEKYCGKKDIITPIGFATTLEGKKYNKRARNYKGFQSVLNNILNRIAFAISSYNHKNYPLLLKNYIFHEMPRGNHGIFKHKFSSHMKAVSVKRRLGDLIWNNYFKFTFERNPWDKLVSYYFFMRIERDFNDWVKSLKVDVKSQPINYPLYTINGKIAVDFVGKYENLNDDLNFVLQKLNLQKRNLPYEKKNKKGNRNYRDYFTTETQNYVKKIYKTEIDLLDYSF